MTTILTGLRTNSGYHIGNYLGALLPMIQLQKNLQPTDNFFLFLPDLHSLEVDNDKTVNQNSLENARLFIAAGIDPHRKNTYLYRQSRIPAHSQLQWILSWYTYMGEASRMTQYKDKSQKNQENNKPIPVELLLYPIMMTADILLYNAEYIPVGDDQKQHIEIARDIAERFNNRHGEMFTLPKPWKKQLEFSQRLEGPRIRDLVEPHKKMSKSDSNKNGCILLTDTPEEATKKIMSATTDSIGMIDWNWEKQPGITNLLQLLQLLQHAEQKEIIERWQGKERYGDLKKAVAQEVSQFLTTLQTNCKNLSLADTEALLCKGEKEANMIAQSTLNNVYRAIGLY